MDGKREISNFDFLNFMTFLEKRNRLKDKKTKNYLKNLFCSKKLLTFYIKSLIEEISFLQKDGSGVGEIIQNHGEKVLIKINQEGKYLVNVHPKIDKKKINKWDESSC